MSPALRTISHYKPLGDFAESCEYRKTVEALNNSVDNIIQFLDTLDNPAINEYRDEVYNLFHLARKTFVDYRYMKDNPMFVQSPYKNGDRDYIAEYATICGVNETDKATLMSLGDAFNESSATVAELEESLYRWLENFETRAHHRIPTIWENRPPVFERYFNSLRTMNSHADSLFFRVLGSEGTSVQAKREVADAVREFRAVSLAGVQEDIDVSREALVKVATGYGLDDEGKLRLLDMLKEFAGFIPLWKVAETEALQHIEDEGITGIYDLPGYVSVVLSQGV